jgi:hypothetical protein
LFAILRNHFYSEWRRRRGALEPIDDHAEAIASRPTQLAQTEYGELRAALAKLGPKHGPITRGAACSVRRPGRSATAVDATEVAMSLSLRPGLLALPLLLLLGFPAQARDIEVEIGTGLICDTQEQVERFVALYDGDPQGTVDSVNVAEHDPSACAVSAMAYVRGPQLATARNKDATFQIVPILVLGVVTEAGVKSVPPIRFFSVFQVDELGA